MTEEQKKKKKKQKSILETEIMAFMQKSAKVAIDEAIKEILKEWK